MPRYLNEAGVEVHVSEEMARLVGGLTPIDEPATSSVPAKKSPARKAPAKKAAPAATRRSGTRRTK